jgi:hypothetical protein
LVPGLVPQLEQNFIDWGATIAGAFVIASLAVAVHRWVLLNQANDSWLLLRNRRDVRFALWLSAVKSLFAFIAVILTILPERPRFLSAAFAIATIFCVPIALSRAALVFPAIAVDRKDILNVSFKLTRRHTIRILSKAVTLFVVVLVLVVIPFFPARARSSCGRCRNITARASRNNCVFPRRCWVPAAIGGYSCINGIVIFADFLG